MANVLILVRKRKGLTVPRRLRRVRFRLYLGVSSFLSGLAILAAALLRGAF